MPASIDEINLRYSVDKAEVLVGYPMAVLFESKHNTIEWTSTLKMAALDLHLIAMVQMRFRRLIVSGGLRSRVHFSVSSVTRNQTKLVAR